MTDKPQEWNEAFDKKFFTPEEIEASDARVSAVQKEIDRERVIKGLGCLTDVAGKHCGLCPYKGDDADITCCKRMAEDALALLKEQEPRVMTLEEACGDIDFCWLEVEGYQTVWVSDCVITPNGKQVLIERLTADPLSFRAEYYGKTWRCWSAKPTDAQMEATPWN